MITSIHYVIHTHTPQVLYLWYRLVEGILAVTTTEAFCLHCIYIGASFVYTVQVMCTQCMYTGHLGFDSGCTWLV